jgi:chromosome segregation ATPase
LTIRNDLVSLRGKMAENTRRDAGKNKAKDTSMECASLQHAADALELPVLDDSRLFVPPDEDVTQACFVDLDSTAEFPVLVLDDAVCESDDASVAPAEDATPAPIERRRADEHAALRVQLLESELERLHETCASLSAEIGIRDARVQELQAQAEARDGVIGDLCRRIEELANARLVLENDVEQANARIADLGAAQAAREVDTALVESSLHDAREALGSAEARCIALAAENAELRDAVARHSEAAAGVQQRYEEEVARAAILRNRLQELETYINGSKQRWSALTEELAEFRDWLGVSERREAWALAELTAETNARKRLATEAADLQRRLVKLVAQVAERETAHRDVERRLEEERAAAAQLRTDAATAAARGDRELHAAEEKITRLEGLLREAAHDVDELVTAMEERESKIARLEAELRDRQAAIALLDGSLHRLDPVGVDSGTESLDRSRVRALARDARGRPS